MFVGCHARVARLFAGLRTTLLCGRQLDRSDDDASGGEQFSRGHFVSGFNEARLRLAVRVSTFVLKLWHTILPM